MSDDKNRIPIAEEMRLEKEWFEDAGKQTLETLLARLVEREG